MTAPFHKRLLSYFWEQQIESVPSEINEELYVSLIKGRYQLYTTNAIYSFEDLYYNFLGAFQKMNLEKIPGKKVLILGFGLGSIPIILESKFELFFEYTAVEIDEAVLYLANKYAVPKINSPIQFICTDALQFVESTTEIYDMILVDIFLNDVVPEKFGQKIFLESLTDIMHPEGVILYNKLALTDEDNKESTTFFNEIFNPIFKNGVALEIKGNHMLLNHQNILK